MENQRQFDPVIGIADNLLEKLIEAYNIECADTRREQVKLIGGKLKARLAEVYALIEKYENKADEADAHAEKAKRNAKEDWGGKKLTIDTQNRNIESAWERAKVYRLVATDLREALDFVGEGYTERFIPVKVISHVTGLVVTGHVTPKQLIEVVDETDLIQQLTACNCQPVGETNVVECNCDEAWSDAEVLFIGDNLENFKRVK